LKTWQKILIPVLICVLIAGIYLFFVFRARRDPGIIKQGPAQPKLTMDQLAYIRKMYFSSFDQAKQLEGTTVWIKAGYSLPYYPYSGGTVQFSHRAGLLPAAEKLAVSRVIKAAAPASENNRIPHGSRQYFVVFTLPGASGTGSATQYAAPIGYVQGADEQLFSDQLFYYDDPRKIYDHWQQPVWDAVAAHTPKPGLTENQTRMAVGILQQTDGSTEGNRTVTYVAGPKTWTVTFANGVATHVEESPTKAS
jgi:hypothetical protein